MFRTEMAGSRMVELVEHIVKAIVDHPDQVSVSEQQEDNKILLKLSVHSDDMGKVIGKNGRVIKAIRDVVNASGVVQKKHVHLEIVE